MRRWILLSLALLAGISGQVGAEVGSIAIIAHPDTQLLSISRVELSKIYLKRLRYWGNGIRALPVDQAPESPARLAFSEQVLRRSVVNTEVYWKRMIFSGRAVPPPEVDSDDKVIEYVRKTPGAVGYVAASAERSGVVEVKVRD